VLVVAVGAGSRCGDGASPPPPAWGGSSSSSARGRGAPAARRPRVEGEAAADAGDSMACWRRSRRSSRRQGAGDELEAV
ncbi:unnamed protein product, partial [Urochloa humidicola]